MPTSDPQQKPIFPFTLAVNYDTFVAVAHAVISPEEYARKQAEKAAERANLLPQKADAPKIQGSFTKMPTNMGAPAKSLGPSKKTPAAKRWEIEKILEEHNLHPIEEMVKMIKGQSGAEAPDGTRIPLTNDQRIKILDTLAGYVVPKVKSVEHTGSIDHTVSVTIMKFEDLPQVAQTPIPIDAEVVNG